MTLSKAGDGQSDQGKEPLSASSRFANLKSHLQEGTLADCSQLFSASSLFDLFDDLRDTEEGLLLAVSGGADSLALMLLCAAWQRQQEQHIPLYVATVDHGLREQAKAEAAYVGEVAACLGLDHAILHWHAEKPLSNIQARARDGRYQLLSEHALVLGVRTILTAHHQDDQAETFVMRLQRGSSVRGLSGMRRRRSLNELDLVRPLLGLPKSKLQDALGAVGLAWCEDPSNQDKNFLRVKMRQDLSGVLAEVGLTPRKLAKTAERMARADDALRATTQMWFDQIMKPEAGRALSFALENYMPLPEEFRLRLLQEAIFHVAGAGYPCEENSLVDLDLGLAQFDLSSARLERWKKIHIDGVAPLKPSRKKTLAGCCFEIFKGRGWIYREIGRVPMCEELSEGKSFNWQGILDIVWGQGNQMWGETNGSVTLRPLGQEGRIALKSCGIFEADLPLGPEGRFLGEHPLGLIEALPSGWRGKQAIWVMDCPKIARMTACPLEILEKNTRFTENK